jgi:hypothetical protein
MVSQCILEAGLRPPCKAFHLWGQAPVHTFLLLPFVPKWAEMLLIGLPRQHLQTKELGLWSPHNTFSYASAPIPASVPRASIMY